MKRLLKKEAWGKVELFHATSSQVLMKVVESGYLEPPAYTGVTTNGLNEEIEGTNDRKPSGNQIGVYLGREDVLPWYRTKAVEKTVFNNQLPNIPVDIKVNVETDSLSPDYDDIQIDLSEDEKTDDIGELKKRFFNEDEPLWEQSLNLIDQVVHNGPIHEDEIEAVRFQMSGISLNDNLKDGDPISFLEEFISFGHWMSFEDGIKQLQNMTDAISNLEENPEQQDSEQEQQKNVATRLRKLKQG